jgi:UDP-GlcNAc:undecaprenyl-phosphate GlcNAc-1-phosphate transferase
MQMITPFLLTLGLIIILARLAPLIGLVDAPGKRKMHEGDIPLVGGIAILLTLTVVSLVSQGLEVKPLANNSDAIYVLLLGATVVTVLGIVDDFKGVSVFTRIFVEIIAALIIIEGLDLLPTKLGDLVGTGVIYMPEWVAYPFTVIAIFGVINAYNMLDGMDGLLSIMVLITILTFHVFTGLEPGPISITLCASLAAFLVSNLQISPYIPKTFLGDAGSKLLGFIVVSLILAVTTRQVSGYKYIEPVTALYLVALPLFDMVFISLRRVYARKSPFSGDRTHIHHLMQALDISPRRSVALISCAYLAPAFVGLMLNRADAATPQQFFIFLGLFVVYCLFMSQAWRVAQRYQTLKQQLIDVDTA